MDRCTVQGSNPRLGTCICRSLTAPLPQALLEGPLHLERRYRRVSCGDGGGGQGLRPQGLWLA